MGGYYERNLFFLKKRQPELARVLSLQKRDRTCVDAGRIGKTDALADCTYSDRLAKEPVLYVLGLEQCDQAASCLKRLPRHVRFVVLLEPDPLLLTSFLDTVPVFDILASRICVFATSEDSVLLDEAVAAAFGHSGFLVGRCASSVHFGDDESDRSARSASLANAFERSLSFQIENLGNSPEDSLLGLRQMALSSPWTLFAHQLRTLEGRFGNWPAVIVSAGPSLDKNLHLLKGRENEIVIIAVDTVLGKLLKNGIVPHFVTALERGSVVYDYHFRGVLDEDHPELKTVVLVVQSVCVPRIAGRWPGPVIVVGKRDIVLDREVVGGLLGGRVIPSGASVAHMGLGLANALGCSAVALIGQDLAFAADGRSHAGQTHWEKHSLDMQTPHEERMTVPAFDGGTVETTRIWRYFIDRFSRMASEMPIPVNDCTEGGALIPGAVVMPLHRFIAENPPLETCEAIPQFLNRVLEEPSSRQTDLAAFDRRYIALQQSFHRSKQLIDHALALLRTLEAPVLTSQRRDAVIGDVRKILNDLTVSAPILTYIGQAQFASLIMENYRLTDVSDRPILMEWVRRHREFLQNQATSVEMIIGWLLYIDGVRQMEATLAPMLAADDPESRLAALLEGTGEETFRDAITIDLLLSRVEPTAPGFPESSLLRAALHYMKEKRFEEAARIFEYISSNGENMNGDPDFLTRWATCLVSADLCWDPEFGKARALLSDVFRLEPQRHEIDDLLRRLLRTWIRKHERNIALYRERNIVGAMTRSVTEKESLEKTVRLLEKDAGRAKMEFLAPFFRRPIKEGADCDHAANVCDNKVR